MDIYKTEMFPFLEGDMLNGSQHDLTMAAVTTMDLPTHNGHNEKKYVVHFKETEKGLVLNKTNSKAIAGIYGRETDDWRGQRITLFAEQVQAFGKMHNAVRVKATPPKPPDRPDAPPATVQPAPDTAEPLRVTVSDETDQQAATAKRSDLFADDSTAQAQTDSAEPMQEGMALDAVGADSYYTEAE